VIASAFSTELKRNARHHKNSVRRSFSDIFAPPERAQAQHLASKSKFLSGLDKRQRQAFPYIRCADSGSLLSRWTGAARALARLMSA
jgi:hypothetical protein